MSVRKEIIILNGGGHKGVVKISDVSGRHDWAKVSCSLDFRPSGAYLYLIGANIAKIALNDVSCDVEVPFSASEGIGCVVRSSSLTMFGGHGAKSDMLAKIEEYNQNSGHKNQVNDNDKTAKSKANNNETAIANKTCGKQSIDTPSENEAIKERIAKSLNNESAQYAEEKKIEIEDKKEFAGARSKADVNPLGEWTKYDGNNFYYAIKPQIDEMFICYPEEKLLGATVPNSKWVRVDAEDGYYVVGLLFDEDEPSYICYGVPQYPSAEKGACRAPAELENMCVWLPVDAKEEMEGYWMIYQSAKTGEIIK